MILEGIPNFRRAGLNTPNPPRYATGVWEEKGLSLSTSYREAEVRLHKFLTWPYVGVANSTPRPLESLERTPVSFNN